MTKKTRPIVARTAKDLAEAMELDPADAVEWEMRYSLTNRIKETVRKSEMTVSTIARASGTSRGRITKILKGDTQGISIDVLLRVLGSVGQTIKISYRETSHSTSHPTSSSFTEANL